MKRFWVGLLSLGLVIAFSFSAFAVPGDFTGQYYVRGYYIENNSLLDRDQGTNRASWSFVDQRLRLFPRFKIAGGVTLTTRLDALETIWGVDQRPGTIPSTVGGGTASNWRDFNTPNLSFERVYATFNTGIGQFNVGTQGGTPYGWGTAFMNAPGTAAGVKWTYNYGKAWMFLADWYVQQAGNYDFTTGPKPTPFFNATDLDRDYYDLGARYRTKALEAGFLYTYFRRADGRANNNGTAAANPSLRTNHVFQPYARFQTGPLNIEAEAYYMDGKLNEFQAPSVNPDIDIKAWGLYANARYNMGPFYVGAFFLHATGDDPNTPNKREGGQNSTFGYSSDSSGIFMGTIAPAILFGYWYNNYITLGATGGAPSANSLGKAIDNVTMYSIRAGYAASKKLDFTARVTYAKADEILLVGANANADKDYGTELDIQGTYKIVDNLTYNVGVAYLWTGDYFKKRAPGSPDVENNYMLLHWIDLNF